MRKNSLLLFCVFLVFYSCSSAKTGPVTYKFTTKWNTKKHNLWKKYLEDISGKPNVHYLELGVYEGRSLFWVLDNILTHESSQATGIDAFYVKGTYETLKQNLNIENRKQKIKIIPELFVNSLTRLNHNSYDLIYLDGGHMSWTTLETAILAWPLLKNDGILIFDDYLLDENWPREFRPKLAIDSFLSTYKNNIEVLHRGYQIFIRKIKNSCWERRYACTPIGNWSYIWDKKVLKNSYLNESFSLTKNQIEIIQDYIINTKPKDKIKNFKKKILLNVNFSSKEFLKFKEKVNKFALKNNTQ